jgi:ATP-dependent DNA helicase RecG
VGFKQLGLVIIDEQHRFGVLQRATLRAKGCTRRPRDDGHTDSTHARPDAVRRSRRLGHPELPPGRLPVKTIAKPDSRRDEMHGFVASRSTRDARRMSIYPLVEESDKVDLKRRPRWPTTSRRRSSRSIRVGLLHGRMKPDAKIG